MQKLAATRDTRQFHLKITLARKSRTALPEEEPQTGEDGAGFDGGLGGFRCWLQGLLGLCSALSLL